MRNPIPVRSRRLDLTGLDTRLLTPINRAIGGREVKRIVVAKGAVAMGKGKIQYKPLATIDGCENILRSEQEREQALKAAKK